MADRRAIGPVLLLLAVCAVLAVVHDEAGGARSAALLGDGIDAYLQTLPWSTRASPNSVLAASSSKAGQDQSFAAFVERTKVQCRAAAASTLAHPSTHLSTRPWKHIQAALTDGERAQLRMDPKAADMRRCAGIQESFSLSGK